MIGTYFRSQVCLVLLLVFFLVGCTERNAPPAPTPEVLLQAIPAANSAQFDRIRDMKTWRNPYLIVRRDGVAYARPHLLVPLSRLLVPVALLVK